MNKITVALSAIALSSAFAFGSTNKLGTQKNNCSGMNMSESCHLSVYGAKVKAPMNDKTEVKMNIKNSGNATIDIIAAYSPIDEKTQLHHFVTNSDGQRVMKQINNIEVYPHNTVDLSFQELHVMLIGLKENLKKNATIPVTLILSDGSTIQVKAKVE